MKIFLRVLVGLQLLFLVLPLTWAWGAGALIVGALTIAHGPSGWLLVMLVLGSGLLTAWLLALRFELYARGRIPRLIWFGLVLGFSSAVMLMRTESIATMWKLHGFFSVAKHLYWSGAGPMICVVTCLAIVAWRRKTFEATLNTLVDSDASDSMRRSV